MKQIVNALASLFPFFRHGSFFLLVFLALSLSSCFRHYYQTNTTLHVDADSLKVLQAENKTFVVHTPAGPFALKDVKVDRLDISGEKDFLRPASDHLLNPRGETKNPVSRTEKKTCFSEVHLYTDSTFEGTSHVSLTYNQIRRMDIYGPDKKATSESTIGGVVLITVSTAAVIGIGAVIVNSMNDAMSSMTFNFH
jgi:hypothetical protein